MTRIDEASRWFAAEPDAVFAALLDPEQKTRWLPPRGMLGRLEHSDVREGGGYRMVLTYLDGTAGKSDADSDVVQVRYLQIVPGEKVVEEVDFVSDDPAFAGTMRMIWQVDPAERGSIVTVTAEDVPSGISADDHIEGMSSSLRNLDALLSGSID